MTKKYSTKRALIASVLILALCFTTLIGTTFAWFTDSVTSANNIIKSGRLDVEMYWADGTEDPANVAWTDASTGAIFNYDNWEPGYAVVRHIKIANEGTLALKYKVNIIATGTVSDLADVIDVYYVDPAVQVTDRTALTDATKIGTLTDVLNGLDVSGNGTLEAGKSDTVTIALKMQESAGNEYMDKSIGSSFAIQLLATQFTKENDSFDNQYDKDATYPEVNKVIFEEPTTEEETLPVGNANITLPAGVEGAYEAAISNVEEAVDQDGNDVVSFDLSLSKDGVKVENDGTVYNVSYEIGIGKNITTVLHNGAPIAFNYDRTTGYIYFTVNEFSPFQIVSYAGDISTAEELVENLGKGGTFVLQNDIDLAGINWTPVGTEEEPFSGTFDGNGKTIYNLTTEGYDDAGFISYAGEDAIIHDVTFVNLNVSGTNYAAGVVANAPEGIILNNVTVASGSVSAKSYAGGIVFWANDAKIDGCANYANVSAYRSAGIAAWVTSNANIQNVVNYGTIYGGVGASGIAHGFAGTIKNAVNYGSVTSNHYEAAAGIVGVQKAASTYEYCVNFGDVTSNYDDVNASAAGILGQSAGTASTINYCANFGNVTAKESYAGGIATSLYGTINANYCYNGGIVNGKDCAGAIAPKAAFGATDKANYCLNAGNVYSANGTVYLGSYINVSTFDISTGTITEIGKTSEYTLAEVCAILNGGNDNTYFAVKNNTIVVSAIKDAIAYKEDETPVVLSFEDVLKASDNYSGWTVKLLNDVTLSDDYYLPANFTLNGNGKQINGTVYAGGDLTIEGHVKVTAFSASYYNRVITIGKGACLEVTGGGRVSIAYGNVFNITGTITDAKATDKATVQPSLIVPAGLSITGGSDATMNINNAYIVIGSTSSKNSAANGTFTFNINNSIVEGTNQFTLAEPTSGMNPTFNITIKDSVFTTGTKFVIAAPNSNVVIDNSIVTANTYIRNSGTMTIKNGSVVTGSTIQFGENGGNNGTITVNASTLTINASSTGHALDGKGTGKIIAENGADVTVTYYKDMEVITDETSTFTGTKC